MIGKESAYLDSRCATRALLPLLKSKTFQKPGITYFVTIIKNRLCECDAHLTHPLDHLLLHLLTRQTLTHPVSSFLVANVLL